MKRTTVAVGLAFFLLLLGLAFRDRQSGRKGSLVPSAQAKDKDDDDDNSSCPNKCSLRTLKGCYGTLYSGTINGGSPIAIVAKINYDGAGHLTQIDTVSINGNLFAQGREATGTYTVNPDCTGSQVVTFPDGFVFPQDFVIVKHGTELLGIPTNGGFTVTFTSKKQ